MHLAAETHVDRSIAGPGDFITSNINGTFHLLEACRSHWLGTTKNQEPRTKNRFLHVSTDEVYGSLGESGSFTESSAYAPNSPYAASKAASDMLVRSYHHTYGLPTVITHCSNNHGPYQYPEKLIPVVIQSILARREIPVYGDGLNVRDWLHVNDHCAALWLVLNQGRAAQTYNIGGLNEMANLPLVELICDLVDEIQPSLAGHSRDLITFVPDRLGHDRRYSIDASKIQRELGWKPAHPPESALRSTVQWYLENQSWAASMKVGV
jgi:dTDP-glucose 4,6-dehydratase